MTGYTLPEMPSMLRTFKEFLLTRYQPLVDAVADDPTAADRLVGGKLAFDPRTQPFYIRLDQVYQSGNLFEVEAIIEPEVFGVNYWEVESRCLDIERLLLGYPHVVEVEDRKVILDKVTQSNNLVRLPWEDDDVVRLGATYVITARRR